MRLVEVTQTLTSVREALAASGDAAAAQVALERLFETTAAARASAPAP
jgi:hypothetical protein